MTEALFRQQVIEEGRNRLTGTVIAAVPPSARLYTRLVAVAAAALVALVAFSSFTMTADVRGIVSYDAGVARVYPREAGKVSAIHVHEGSRSRKASRLLR
ncbi:MAG: hypothetical protein ABIT09_09970 [Croceibacterium sp.]